jgi:hypothetical protein
MRSAVRTIAAIQASRERVQLKRSTPPKEMQALKTLALEAKKAGATLLTGGRGGLPPSLVLGVFRRDGYVCKRCGGRSDLTLHHKGGVDNPVSAWLANKGKRNDFNNLVVACAKCHQAIHDEDRNVSEAVEADSVRG